MVLRTTAGDFLGVTLQDNQMSEVKVMQGDAFAVIIQCTNSKDTQRNLSMASFFVLRTHRLEDSFKLWKRTPMISMTRARHQS